jgi:sulfur carrier protein
VRIRLNGEPRELPGPLSVQALLDELGIDGRMVAVELNLSVIRRARYADTVIEEGAEVEIVAFIGGGSGGPRDTV